MNGIDSGVDVASKNRELNSSMMCSSLCCAGDFVWGRRWVEEMEIFGKGGFGLKVRTSSHLCLRCCGLWPMILSNAREIPAESSICSKCDGWLRSRC